MEDGIEIQELASVSRDLVGGETTAAVAGAVGILTTYLSGNPVLGAMAVGGTQRLAVLLCDTATTRMAQAGKEFENEQARQLAMEQCLRSAMQDILDGVRSDGDAQFLQTLSFMQRNVASAEVQNENARVLREILAQLSSKEVAPDPNDWFAELEQAGVKRGEGFARLLSELLEEQVDCEDWFDPAWPLKGDWASLLRDSAISVVGELAIKLSPPEKLVILAFTKVVELVAKYQAAALFDTEDRDASYARLISINPVFDRLPDSSNQEGLLAVKSWCRARLLNEDIATIQDKEAQQIPLKSVVAQELLANPQFTTTLRVVHGDIDQFPLLAESAVAVLGTKYHAVRWRLLSCILLLADCRILRGVHLPEVVMEQVAHIPEVSAALDRHLCDATMVSEEGQRWIVKATCSEPILDFGIGSIAETLDERLHRSGRILADYFVLSHQKSFPRITADIVPAVLDGQRRYSRPHVQFQLSPHQARKLFMGTNLWGDTTYAFRELFQNALDACRYAKARHQVLGLEFAPHIRIHHGKTRDGREFVECLDTGVGMTRHVVAECFAKAGERFVQTDEFRRERQAWADDGVTINTNSQFGIGVFSYFLVAERIEIETARLGLDCEKPARRLHITIPTAASFFRIVDWNRGAALTAYKARVDDYGGGPPAFLETGTRVRLWLTPGSESIKMVPRKRTTAVSALREHVLVSEVDLKVTDFTGGEYRLLPGELDSNAFPRAHKSDADFWWLPELSFAASLVRDSSISNFRTRFTSGGTTVPSRNPGRILVDGIATGVETPGFVLNFVGPGVPTLSLDRRAIREDISAKVETRVVEALEAFPSAVSYDLLADLWQWDPRIAVLATDQLKALGGSWSVRQRPDDGGVGPTWATRPFFPALDTVLKETSKRFDRPDNRTWLVGVIRLACEHPDARLKSSSVLALRNVGSELSKNLSRIPRSIWRLWSDVYLDCFDACALACPLDASSETRLMSMSWLSGKPLRECHERTLQIAPLFDWPIPLEPIRPEYVVTDFDAWVLARGRFDQPWCSPSFTTLDLALYRAETNKALEEGMKDLETVAESLGARVDVDRGLAEEVGMLDRDEILGVRMTEIGFTLYGVAGARRDLLSKLFASPPPDNHADRKADPRNTSEEERVFRKRFLSALGSAETFGISALVELSKAANKGARELVGEVESVSEAVGVSCSFEKHELERVCAFGELEWSLANRFEGAYGAAPSVKPRERTQLLGFIRSVPYGTGVDEIWNAIQNVYDLFKWELPVSNPEVVAARKWSYEAAGLISQLPKGKGRFSIVELLMAAQQGRHDLVSLNAYIQELAPVQEIGPPTEERYMGFSWEQLVSEAYSPEPQGSVS